MAVLVLYPASVRTLREGVKLGEKVYTTKFSDVTDASFRLLAQSHQCRA